MKGKKDHWGEPDGSSHYGVINGHNVEVIREDIGPAWMLGIDGKYVSIHASVEEAKREAAKRTSKSWWKILRDRFK